MGKFQSERLRNFPNIDLLLKISLGLILLTMISSVLVYAETISVDVEGNSFNVEYTTTGMTVSDVTADLELISLILAVDVSNSPGTLDITFDRAFFDSTYEGLDDDFLVLADGDFANFTETSTTSQSRTLSVELPTGTEEVEIIGSVFGSLVSIPIEEPTKTEKPVVEEPTKTEKPVVEEPTKTEKPVVDETPKTQCGTGTVLKEGVCILDERCGPGTVLQNGACVLEPVSTSSEISVKGMGKEMITGIIAAFVIAGIIGIVLALMSKASKSKN